MISRLIEKFDDEEHEYEVRWILWKMKWFPYRTILFEGWDEERKDLIWGETKWHLPNILRRRSY